MGVTLVGVCPSANVAQLAEFSELYQSAKSAKIKVVKLLSDHEEKVVKSYCYSRLGSFLHYMFVIDPQGVVVRIYTDIHPSGRFPNYTHSVSQIKRDISSLISKYGA